MTFSKLLAPFAKRFVAGETAGEAVEVARQMNRKNIQGIIDYLGEDIHSAAEARQASDEYLRVLSLIEQQGVNACLSLKLSQMGLRISPDVCRENLERILDRGKTSGHFVWIDMEGSTLTQSILDVFERVQGRYSNVGLCLQAYLYRTAADIERLSRKPFHVRLCKGAYKERSHIAFASHTAVNDNFRALLHTLFGATRGDAYPAIATHDPSLIRDAIRLSSEKKMDVKRLEFQMLLGIQNRLLEQLALQGFQTGVYIPYGTAWFPYFLRRLRERKENVYFLFRNLFSS